MDQSEAAAKVALRRDLRGARRERVAASDESSRRELGRRLAAHLAQFLADARTPCVAVFESLPTEPPTEEIIATLRSAGYQVIAPILLADKDLSWRDLATDEDLGVTAIADAAVIVLPALAVDVTGRRLGQGGGSYDRALLRSDPEALRLAVVFDDEVLTAVPADDHDQPVDAVLTPDQGVRRLPLPD
ncbi:5-formyltetrahydrofolate cyclo-ligase [Branchiibius sp. NY16-3462-2]|uniref:5-formyltetrahydrofolate cyclo-ligase n=1 Tax=Branchiibius sp. NY16-3462-2 TaxID=1807500 RepID=UPI0025C61494|nr:5-formyltetrahydrofolate cyclo-ligase [Branchiibius sp. NY16-3462-2]